jgi:hypothetical protein
VITLVAIETACFPSSPGRTTRGRWFGCRGAGCGAGAELPLAIGLFSDATYRLPRSASPHDLSSSRRRPSRTPASPPAPAAAAASSMGLLAGACAVLGLQTLSMDAAGLKDRKVGPSAHCNKKAHISSRKIGSSSLLRFKRFSAPCQSELRLTRVAFLKAVQKTLCKRASCKTVPRGSVSTHNSILHNVPDSHCFGRRN